MAPNELEDSALPAVVARRRLIARGLDPRVHEKRAENVDDAVPRAEDRSPRGDEGAARDERADDAPFEHAVLLGFRNLQSREHDEKHEQVIDAEALLDQVRREIVLRGFRAEFERDPPAENERPRDPNDAPRDGGLAALPFAA